MNRNDPIRIEVTGPMGAGKSIVLSALTALLQQHGFQATTADEIEIDGSEHTLIIQQTGPEELADLTETTARLRALKTRNPAHLMEALAPEADRPATRKTSKISAAERHALPMTVPGYEELAEVLLAAYNQSARGKGSERHNPNHLPFTQQPIMNIARMVGLAGHTYQVGKKSQEATTMAGVQRFSAAQRELLGVIVYAAAAYLLTGEMADKATDQDEDVI